jgi:ankyrin repeat protein
MNASAESVAPKELVRLCRAGQLYEIANWISAGKSLDISDAIRRGRQKSLLEVAVEAGFHSLVELIVRNESSQSAKDAALSLAVSLRRLDIVELLCANGAEVRSVPFADVLLTWQSELFRFFLDHGADPVTDRAFAEVFGAKIRTALRAFLDCKRAHPELAIQLQEQIDCALRYFCDEGDLKWVCLLMWAGGDARSCGPVLNQENTEDPECFTSGLKEACHSENLDVLKKLKPNPDRDNLSELLHCAAIWRRSATLEYLLELGAPPNDKANGGSSALDTVLHDLRFLLIAAHGTNRLNSRYEVRQVFDCVPALVSHGAAWRPDTGYELASLRRALLEFEPSVTIDVLQIFRKHNVCSAETVRRLVGTPQMREHLKLETNALLRLGLHLEMKTIGRKWKEIAKVEAAGCTNGVEQTGLGGQNAASI